MVKEDLNTLATLASLVPGPSVQAWLQASVLGFGWVRVLIQANLDVVMVHYGTRVDGVWKKLVLPQERKERKTR